MAETLLTCDVKPGSVFGVQKWCRYLPSCWHISLRAPLEGDVCDSGAYTVDSSKAKVAGHIISHQPDWEQLVYRGVQVSVFVVENLLKLRGDGRSADGGQWKEEGKSRDPFHHDTDFDSTATRRWGQKDIPETQHFFRFTSSTYRSRQGRLIDPPNWGGSPIFEILLSFQTFSQTREPPNIPPHVAEEPLCTVPCTAAARLSGIRLLRPSTPKTKNSRHYGSRHDQAFPRNEPVRKRDKGRIAHGTRLLVVIRSSPSTADLRRIHRFSLSRSGAPPKLARLCNLYHFGERSRCHVSLHLPTRLKHETTLYQAGGILTVVLRHRFLDFLWSTSKSTRDGSGLHDLRRHALRVP